MKNVIYFYLFIKRENASSFKAEIATLTRKLNLKEKVFEESKKNFEKTLDEYKVKMTDLIRFNDCSTMKIKELEEQRDDFREIIRNIETENLHLNSESKKNYEIFEEERRIKEGIKSDYYFLKERMKTLIQMLRELQMFRDANKNEADKFFNNLFNFYNE